MNCIDEITSEDLRRHADTFFRLISDHGRFNVAQLYEYVSLRLMVALLDSHKSELNGYALNEKKGKLDKTNDRIIQLPVKRRLGLPNRKRDRKTIDMFQGEKKETHRGPKLRWYQEEAIAAIRTSLLANRSTLCVLPTGTGKTVLFSSICKSWDGRVLVLAHRDELISQARETLQKATGEFVGTEKAEYRAGNERLVVASIQTIHRRLDLFGKDHFALIIVDEAHRAIATSYLKVFDYFTSAKVLGVTATPDRSDEKAMGQVFDDVAYVMDIEDGIDSGYLVPVRGKEVFVEEVDLSNVSTSAGDLAQGELDQEMLKATESVVRKTYELAGSEQVIIFTPGVASAHAMCDRMNEMAPGKAIAIDGGTEPGLRKRLVDGFKKGQYQFLMNCAVATEGFDAPSTAIVAIARPTKSRSLYAQMCLDSQTEILTVDGWRGIDDPDSEWAAGFSSNGTILWHKIEEYTRREAMPGEEMWGIKTSSLDIRVTGKHKMVTRTSFGRNKRRLPWELVDADSAPRKFELPVCGVQPQTGLPLFNSEITFLGFLLTDGSVNKANGAATLYQSERYPEALAEMRRCIEGCGFKYKEYVETKPTNFGPRNYPLHKFIVSKGKPRGTDKHLRGWGDLEPYVDRDISARLDGMDNAQFELFVRAMWLGDGIKKAHVKDYTPRTIDICTVRKGMADRLQSMAVRRGWRCNVDVANNGAMYMVRMTNGKNVHNVVRRASDSRPCWTRMETVPGERVWCIRVATGMIVTRRNGKVAIVGNCGRATRVLPGTVDHIDGKDRGAERRSAIAASKKTHATILDFVGNSGRHSLVGPVDVLGGSYTEEEVKLAKKKVREGEESPRQALQDARQELRRTAVAMAAAKVKARITEFDPFKTIGMRRDSEEYLSQRFGSQPMTEGQRNALKKFGMGERELGVMDKRSASKALNRLVDRAKKGLASLWQIEKLSKHMKVPDDVSFQSAMAACEYIKRNPRPDMTHLQLLLSVKNVGPKDLF